MAVPRWLDRLLPNVDIEGAALERRHHEQTPVAAEAETTTAPAPKS